MSAIQPLAGPAPTPYQPRGFSHLAKLEGLSQTAIELHLEIYRGYVANVNRLLAERESDVRRFTYEYNGMILHEQFFEQFSSKAVALPRRGKFVKALGQCFASVEVWTEDLHERARIRCW
ncbi:MAG: hypothetical protein ACREQZ_05740 [Woeseiaceae bacterium]